MPLSADEVYEAVEQLYDARAQEQPRLERIDRALHDNVTGQAAGVYVPRRATREYRLLVEQARFNVLDLVVTSVVQNLYVDGFRSGDEGTDENVFAWDEVWQPNRMDARQAALFRAAISHGVSYALVLPGEPGPVITPMSARRLTALYVDPVNDEWPELALEVEHVRTVAKRKTMTCRVFDDTSVYTVESVESSEGRQMRVVDVAEHGLGVCPVVRFRDRYELDVPCGKVEPLIPLQQQINQTTFGLAMALQYQAFRQRWVTGMQIAEDSAGNPKAPFNVYVDTILQGESPDTKFGSFEQTDLSGYLSARDKQLLHVASVAQIPPHNLLIGAGISNISAEALAALEAGHRQDIAEHQQSFGESVEQLFRLAGKAMDDNVLWEDRSGEVVWRDTTPRSLAQIVDAWGKATQMLEVPPEETWEFLPGVTEQRRRRWASKREDAKLQAELEQMAAGGDGGDQFAANNLGAPAAAGQGGGGGAFVG